MKTEQIQQIEEARQSISGTIRGFSYNQISITEDNTNKNRVIYFEGLQKRVLSGIDEQFLKRLKRIELYENGNFWETGINLFVCCDDCNNALFSIYDDADDLNDKSVCEDCDKWLCSDCIKDGNRCKNCFKNQVARKL
jgi:hypothetical protein